MAQRRKISVRKILQALVTLVVTTACIAAITSATKVHNERKLKGFVVRIDNPQYKFVNRDEIKTILIDGNYLDVKKDGLSKMDINRLEHKIGANPWVEHAQLYIDNRMVLHADVTQRVPVVRLFDQSGNSYYLDRSLKAMPLSGKYVHYATVVTNVPVLKDDSAGNAMKGQIVALVKHIEQDTFWNAQVSQVIVTDDRTFEVVPVLGNQRIIIGDTSNLEDKFHNLLSFYKKIMNRIGWDKYEVLDLRYAGQVVASPALQWKMPKERALSNMDWVKSIINDTPKNATAPVPPAIALAGGPATEKAAAKPADANAGTTIKPAAAKPAVNTTVTNAKPVTAKPAIAKPVVAKPKPAATKPAVTAAKKLATKVPVAAKPVKKTLPAKAVTKDKKQIQTITKKDVPAKAKQPEKTDAGKREQKAKEQSKPKYVYPGNANPQ